MRTTEKQPLVSVIIPVFNGNGFLPAAIISILNQTYKNFELIVIDDGSTDNSFDIMKRFAKQDSRIRVYRNSQNLNIANTLNRGIKLAKSQYIARMDADDVALPHRLEKQMHFLLTHPPVVIVGGQCQTIDITGKVIGQKHFPVSNQNIKEALFTSNPIQHPTAIINRALLPNDFAWYNPALPPAEDYDLFFRLAKYGTFHNLKSIVLQYRQYLGSETFKNPVNTFYMTKKVRHLAVTQYGYRPSLKSWLIHFLQVALIACLPDTFIYPVYVFIRGIKYPSFFRRQSIRFLLKSVNNLAYRTFFFFL